MNKFKKQCAMILLESQDIDINNWKQLLIESGIAEDNSDAILESILLADTTADRIFALLSEAIKAKTLKEASDVEDILNYLKTLSKAQFDNEVLYLLDPKNKMEIFNTKYIGGNKKYAPKVAYQKLVDGIRGLELFKSAAHAGSAEEYRKLPWLNIPIKS